MFCELPKLRGRKPVTTNERWAGLFTAAPLLTAATVATEPFTAEQRAALELANEATFTGEEMEAYRKARDEVQQMVQYGRDAEARGRNEGLRRGRDEGLATVIRLFERKLARALTAEERGRLNVRLATVGADRLGDLVLDLDGDQLAAWLGDHDGR